VVHGDRMDSGIPGGAEVLLSKDIVRDITEGNLSIVRDLCSRALQNRIVLFRSCICEGLELAETPTAEGLNALGRLIAVSAVLNSVGDLGRIPEGRIRGRVTADALLSYLIGSVGAHGGASLFRKMKDLGVLVATRDADLVVALLAIRKGDTLNTRALAESLREIYIERVDESMEKRKSWSVPNGFADELRKRALQEE